MPSKGPVRVGIVGMGLRGQSYVRSAQLVRDCQVVAVCDKIEALAQRGREQAPDSDIQCYTDLGKMLKDASVDAVFVVVEPENNAEVVCQALEAGKHVLAEVPLALSIEDCWRVVLSVEKTGLKFQLGEQVRYSAWVQAWKKMVAEGTLGKPLYAEGQYLHGVGPDRYWHDAETGERITFEEAKTRKAHKSRFWNLRHAIYYLPHELSPLLHILDDRVVRVTGMGTRPQSYRHEWFPQSDIEVALMHTEKDTVLRMLTGFIVETLVGSEHSCRLIGTQGWVEQGRTRSEKGKVWLADHFLADKMDTEWQFANYWDAPPEAKRSGHGGRDYYPLATFVTSVKDDSEPAMDVYKAAETAAPAILAAESIERENVCLAVPDFRPGDHRKPGCAPS